MRNAERNRTIDLGGGATITAAVAARSADRALALGREREQRRRPAGLPGGRRPVRGGRGAADGALAAGLGRAPARAGAQGRAPRRPLFVDGEVPARGVAAGGGDLRRARSNEYGHPTPEAIGRLERAHARVYRTDQDGTVTLETDGARIQVTTASGKREILAAPDDAEGDAPRRTKTTAVFVDAVENGRARLLLGEDAFTVPAALLPDGAGEGTWLKLSVDGDAARKPIRTRSAASSGATIPADRSSCECPLRSGHDHSTNVADSIMRGARTH